MVGLPHRSCTSRLFYWLFYLWNYREPPESHFSITYRNFCFPPCSCYKSRGLTWESGPLIDDTSLLVHINKSMQLLRSQHLNCHTKSPLNQVIFIAKSLLIKALKALKPGDFTVKKPSYWGEIKAWENSKTHTKYTTKRIQLLAYLLTLTRKDILSKQ